MQDKEIYYFPLDQEETLSEKVWNIFAVALTVAFFAVIAGGFIPRT